MTNTTTTTAATPAPAPRASRRYFASNLMSQITSNAVLDDVFAKLVKKREHDSHNSDIWDVRSDWPEQRRMLRTQLLAGAYQLTPVTVFGNRDGHRLTRWSSLDSIVLKAITQVLTTVIQPRMDRRCHHLKGNGGLKAGVNRVNQTLSQRRYPFVIKSDIADFYASMPHDLLLAQCSKLIKDDRILALLQQYMNRVEVQHGNHNLIDIGIAKGCPLSPLMGAIMLKSLDKMVPPDCAYARYMDDWVIFIKTRRQMRRVIKNMHELMRGLKLKLALNKTFFGRVSKGFDFLGYRFNANGLFGLAQKTLDNHQNKRLQLHEQGASDQRVQAYITAWQRWVRSGIKATVGCSI